MYVMCIRIYVYIYIYIYIVYTHDVCALYRLCRGLLQFLVTQRTGAQTVHVRATTAVWRAAVAAQRMAE